MPVISVQNLGKEYIIGSRERQHDTFYEKLASGLKNPFRRYKQLAGEVAQEERFWALKDVSFEVKEGEVVGIIGRNGAGKSTLLKILSRITEPTKGRVTIRGRVASLLEVGTGFHPELTGRENIFLNGAILGMTRRDIEKRFDEIVAFAEVEKFLDTPIKRYSSGMYVRLAFAVAAHLEPDVLAVDEVLAVGDLAFQQKCLGKMEDVSKAGRTVLFVSHNMDAIRKLCRKAMLLDKGLLVETGDIQSVFYRYMVDSRVAPKKGYVIPLGEDKHGVIEVLRIEVRDKSGRAKEIVSTWDEVVFRIVVRALTTQKNTSIVLQISTLTGAILHTCSTQPDRDWQVDLSEGRNVIDCVFPRLMLSAGTYRIGAGVAIPNVSWLCNKLDQGILIVSSSDVYNSGTAPNISRYLVPVEYEWRNASYSDDETNSTGMGRHL